MTASRYHLPVMLDEVLEYMAPRPGMKVVDVTLGGGGHAREVLKGIEPGGIFVGMDRDPDAICNANTLEGSDEIRVEIVKGQMSDLSDVARKVGIENFDLIFADLGVSSHQFDCGERGFSFREDAPLDMRMDPSKGESAANLLARLSEDEIENIIRDFGEDRFAKRIAAAIAMHGRVETTRELAGIVKDAYPGFARHSRIHPATRTFQAIRIAVNDELGELESLLESAPGLLSKDGRLLIISYHSLEDRRVKNKFRELEKTDEFRLPKRKAIKPSAGEVESNPRARSARMRVLERIA